MQALTANALKPDNLPILGMLLLIGLLLPLWWRVARRNDRLLEEGGEPAVLRDMEGTGSGEPPEGGRLATWPHLLRIELLAALAALLLLTIWSILVDAPLEAMADPARTPNPSKAPWYFVGLQEMLVYFDPWLAGVVFPSLMVVGLCLVPYLDVNPEGNGYYSWRRRRFAISVFLFGFLGLWIFPILVGVFCRGPGWAWFWPWEAWDRWSVSASSARDWAALFGVTSRAGASLFGGLTVVAYYGLGLLFWLLRRESPALVRLGGARYAVVAFLFLTMLSLPIKVVLRLGFSVKYVWVTPWFSI